MSLYENAKTPCIVINELIVDDGYGGTKTVYTEGAGIDCAIVLNNSIQAQIAQRQGTTAFYTISTDKNINLKYHNLIKRLSDGKIFRVTSNSDDNATPDTAGLDIRQVTAEEWSLPNE